MCYWIWMKLVCSIDIQDKNLNTMLRLKYQQTAIVKYEGGATNVTINN